MSKYDELAEWEELEELAEYDEQEEPIMCVSCGQLPIALNNYGVPQSAFCYRCK